MFNFSFGEIVVIAVAALVVIGPERLPEAARFVGRYVRHARRHIGEAHAFIRREMQMEDVGGLEDMKNIHRDLTKIGRDAKAALRSATSEVSEGTRKMQAEVMDKGEEAKLGAENKAATEEKPSPPSTVN